MKVLFIGDYKYNVGPANVNKNLKNHLPNNFLFIKGNNFLIKIFELFFKIFISNVIIISGYKYKLNIFFKIAKLLNKKLIYLMHGCIKYENQINNLKISDKIVNNEIIFLKSMDLILCVSKNYMKWVSEYYPDVKEKLYFLNNGIEKNNFNFNLRNSKKREKIVIAVFGGNRNIKNNCEICKAVQVMLDSGQNVELHVFGKFYENNEDLSSYTFLKIHGHINQNTFYDELKNNINIGICNSEVEPFGLAIIESLFCGCDIIVSKNTGASSIMKLSENDIINDPHNINEIIEKIKIVHENPNHDRILQSIDINSITCKTQSEELVKICENVFYKNNR